MLEFDLRPIGAIKTSLESAAATPIQSRKSEANGEAIVDQESEEGLTSLDLFSHVILLYWFHRSTSPRLKVVPHLGQSERGLFSTRPPSRPNPIGISVVELLRVEGNRLIFKGADMLDGTPLIDIKPFIPEFDCRPTPNSGWLREFLENEGQSFLDDTRFQG